MDAPKTVPPTPQYSNKLFSPKLILVYLVVAALIYALVYYFLVAGKKTKLQTTPQSPQSESGEQTNPQVLTVTLTAQNNSGQPGTAIIAEENGKAKVSLFINNAPKGVAQPAHIHAGACPGVGEVKYPLSNVLDGKSETALDVGIDQLKSELPLAVNVHKSASEARVYVSCGPLE